MKENLCFALNLFRDPSQRKHVLRWLYSLRQDHLLKSRQPWLTYDAIDYLDSLSFKGRKVFEYGSGGSTLYWLKRNAECVSIEHDPVWYAVVNQHLKGKEGITYKLVLPEPCSDDEAGDVSDPMLYLSADKASTNFCFQNYVRQIDCFPDDHFDFILIDGRSRPSCIMHSARKLKMGGVLILDNSDREYYLSKTRDYLIDFVEKRFCGVMPTKPQHSITSIYIKDSDNPVPYVSEI